MPQSEVKDAVQAIQAWLDAPGEAVVRQCIVLRREALQRRESKNYIPPSAWETFQPINPDHFLCSSRTASGATGMNSFQRFHCL